MDITQRIQVGAENLQTQKLWFKAELQSYPPIFIQQVNHRKFYLPSYSREYIQKQGEFDRIINIHKSLQHEEFAEEITYDLMSTEITCHLKTKCVLTRSKLINEEPFTNILPNQPTIDK